MLSDPQLGCEFSERFNPLILKKNNSFCVYLPEWKISGVGLTLEDAYNEYSKNLKSTCDHFNKFGLSNLTSEPYPKIKNREIKRELTIFLSKVFLSSIVIVMIAVALMPIMSAALKDALKKTSDGLISAELRDPRYWAVKFPSDINEKLDRMSEEERKKMLAEWNELLTRTSPLWKPLKCN